MKVVAKDRETCWSCLGQIHRLLPPRPGRLSDYISSPKENLYMSLHTTVLMDGAPVEVYIKSTEMDWVADFGVAAYWRHGEDLALSGPGRALQEALRSTWLQEASDSLEQSLRSVEVTSKRESARRVQEQDSSAASMEREDLREDLRQDLEPLLEQVAQAACGCAGGREPCRGVCQVGGWSSSLGSVHRAYNEALREKVTVFTPTGRVVFLPRDATALDFAVWNLEEIRREGGATEPDRLREGQTVIVQLRGEGAVPPREWGGVHLRYLRTSRARAALVAARTEMLSEEEAAREGEEAVREELLLHSLDPDLLARLGGGVFAAVGRGALPVELVSAQVLALQLALPLGDAGYEYAEAALHAALPETAEASTALSFVMLVEDRPGVMREVVEAVREHGMDMRRFVAEPRGPGRCLIIVKVCVDCALRFGSLLHCVRYRTRPLLLQRVPAELAAPPAPGAPAAAARTPLGPWFEEAPAGLDPDQVREWKAEALKFALPAVPGRPPAAQANR
ncbi:unnamed protein product [Prorocentrum cordatum]|uniref:RelA/SpoT domain-containing protein n=1 Tax=Prorocentrum cordatum TaxID=2364126 RepID=A0ABN9XXH3_9DINO|nr:unnamed protein product [Polarella glacialis]